MVIVDDSEDAADSSSTLRHLGGGETNKAHDGAATTMTSWKLLTKVLGIRPSEKSNAVQIFFREHQKVLDLVAIVLYIPRRCARRKKTSQLRGSGDVKQISVAVDGGSSKGETPDVAVARCGAEPEKGTRRFSIRKMSNVVAGDGAQAASRAAA